MEPTSAALNGFNSICQNWTIIMDMRHRGSLIIHSICNCHTLYVVLPGAPIYYHGGNMYAIHEGHPTYTLQTDYGLCSILEQCASLLYLYDLLYSSPMMCSAAGPNCVVIWECPGPSKSVGQIYIVFTRRANQCVNLLSLVLVPWTVLCNWVAVMYEHQFVHVRTKDQWAGLCKKLNGIGWPSVSKQ